MNNEIYIHEDIMIANTVYHCFDKVFDLCKNKGIDNIQLVLSNLRLIDTGNNFLSLYISNRTGDDDNTINNSLKRNRVYRFNADGIGLNVCTTRSFTTTANDSTVVLVVWTFAQTFSQIKTAIENYNNDVVLCTPNIDEELESLLSDFNVIHF